MLSNRLGFKQTAIVKYNPNNPNEYVMNSGWNGLLITGIIMITIVAIIFISIKASMKKLSKKIKGIEKDNRYLVPKIVFLFLDIFIKIIKVALLYFNSLSYVFTIFYKKGGIFMMSEKQFIESQKECASMLGMSLSEYEEYCKNLKVPTESAITKSDNDDKTMELLNYLWIDKNLLKSR